jgi:hypothetical protein
VGATGNSVGVTSGKMTWTSFTFVPIRAVRFRSGSGSFGARGVRSGGQRDQG